MQITIESNPIAVRRGLAALLTCPPMTNLNESARDTAEIVLAEVLNNIVEHAYAEKIGDICVSLQEELDGLQVVVSDEGNAFPKETLPLGILPLIDSFEDLPEGGFGWHLIRSLVQNLTYRRLQASNHLSFFLPAETKVH